MPSVFWSRHFEKSNPVFNEIAEIGLSLYRPDPYYIGRFHKLIVVLEELRLRFNFMLQAETDRFARERVRSAGENAETLQKRSEDVNGVFDGLVRRFLNDSSVSLDAADAFGKTLLHYAGERGSPQLLKILLDKVADVRAVAGTESIVVSSAVVACREHLERRCRAFALTTTDECFPKLLMKRLYSFCAVVEAKFEDWTMALHFGVQKPKQDEVDVRIPAKEGRPCISAPTPGFCPHS